MPAFVAAQRRPDTASPPRDAPVRVSHRAHPDERQAWHLAESALAGRVPHSGERPRRQSSRSGASSPSFDAATLGSAQPLDAALRDDFETRFGHDFSRVRVHADTRADAAARAGWTRRSAPAKRGPIPPRDRSRRDQASSASKACSRAASPPPARPAAR